jgi:UPF0042 nucleotide-binding protein
MRHVPEPEPGGATNATRDLVLITGMSGAGRTEALHTFEDLGYFCIDNLPPTLIGQIVSLTSLPGSRVHRIAVACDVRGGAFFEELTAALDDLEASGHSFRILFLTADDHTLISRFKETRRRHPLVEYGSVAEGIAAERSILDVMRQRAELIIDTSDMRPQELRARIREAFVAGGHEDQLFVTVSSFGFKYGAPIDADIIMDVRFLPNPHYIDRLRPKTGLDRPVRTFVLDKPEADQFIARWFSMLEFLLPNYLTEGKTHLNIALGCTGGQHRSVVLAEETAAFVRTLGYPVTVSHRDMGKDRER